MGISSTRPEKSTGEINKVWAAALVLTVATRVAWVLVVPVVPIFDGHAYDLLAQSLVRGDGYGFEPGVPSAFWPVGTAAFYALLYRIFGVSFTPIIVANILIGAATVWPRPNSPVTRGPLDSRSGRSVPKSRLSQKSRVLRLSRIPWILRSMRVAKFCRKTSELCDEFRDKRTGTPA